MNQPREILSEIERVDVYRAQVLITRRARLDLGAGQTGAHDLKISGLPIHLRDDSVRIELPGKAGARVADLHLEWEFSPRDIPLRTDLEGAMRRLKRELAEVCVERNREQDRVRFLQGLMPGNYPAGQLPESLAFGERRLLAGWLQLLDYVRSEEAGRRQRIRRLDRKAQLLHDQIAAAGDQLEKQSHAELDRIVFLHKTARLRLELDQPLPALDLRISYLAPAARWIPEYELRVFDDRDEAELVLKALAAQQTGEDWEGLPISFSTANLSRSAEIPEVESWRIGKAQPPRKSGWRPLPEGLDDLFEAYDREMTTLPAVAVLRIPKLPAVPRLGEPACGAAEPPPEAAAAPGPKRRAAAAAAGQPAADTFLDEIEAAGAPGAPLPPAGAGATGEFTRLFAAPQAAPSAPVPLAPAAVSEPEALPAEAGVAASREALDYSRLRLRGPEDRRRRGQLEAASLAEQFTGPAAAQILPRLGRLPLPAYGVELDRSAGHFSVRYAMEGAGSIPADGQFHSLTLLRREGRIRRTYRCVPVVDDKVYEIVEFDNPLQLALLAGPVRVYRGADFVVTSPLPTAPPGKTLAVNVGVEPGILVARNTSFRETAGGLLGGATVLEHKVEIELRSKLSKPARVEVIERVPRSTSGDVKVEVIRTEPGAEIYDQAERDHPIRGGWRFRLELGPRESRTCVLEYRILIPNKQVLVGGNRRG